MPLGDRARVPEESTGEAIFEDTTQMEEEIAGVLEMQILWNKHQEQRHW